MLLSRDMFDKLDAQQWWANNCEKIHELYNVRKRNTQLLRSLPLPQHREDKVYQRVFLLFKLICVKTS